jgi:hypothetical protein
MSLSSSPKNKTGCRSADTVEDRLQVIADMLIYGGSRQEILALAQKRWGVSLRTAQDYLHTVQQRLAGEAAQEDLFLALRVSQLQRDKLVGLALRYTCNPPADLDPRVLQALASLITAVRGLLDSRDRTAAEITALVDRHIQQAEHVVPPREAACLGTNGDGRDSALGSVRAWEGERVKARQRQRAAPAKRSHARTLPRSHVAVRPPLPAGASETEPNGGVSMPNTRADHELESESMGTAVTASVCAGCARSP